MEEENNKSEKVIATSIEVPICFYEDDDGNKVYDYETMAEEFENELSKLVTDVWWIHNTPICIYYNCIRYK